jgi:FMN reductase (NADPH)
MSKTNLLIESILNRKSIREFTDEKIPQADINTIVEGGQRAPTGGNSQLYILIEVRDDLLRKKMTEVCHNQEFINEASHFFVICADTRRVEQILLKVGQGQKCPSTLSPFVFPIMDATFVAQNMVVVAEALGYGTIYIGSVANKVAEVSTLLKLPKGVLPVVGLAIGVSAEQPPCRPRFPPELIWQIDQYRDAAPEKLTQAIEIMNEALQQEGYYEKYGLASQSEYLWSTHVCRKFGGELAFQWTEEAEQKQKEETLQQGFLEDC